MRRVCLVATLPLLLVMTADTNVAAGGQAIRVLNRRSDSVARLMVWAEAVRQHLPGQFDAPAAGAAEWTAQQLIDLDIELNNLLVLMENPNARSFTAEDRQFRSSDVLYGGDDLNRLKALALAVGGRDPLNRGRDQAESDRVAAARIRLLKRAAILHTDVARLADRQPSTTPLGPLQGRDRSVVQFYDGEVLGIDRSGDQWDFARRLLDRVRPGQTRDPDVLLWYRATLQWMLGTLQLQWPQFERAQQIYPDDPDLMYLRGHLHENLASPRVQIVARAITAAGGQARVRAPRDELRDAESYLGRALKARPQLVDAQLRLGRVQTLLGKDADAVRTLQAAITATDDRQQQYYANLFLGSALESLDRPDQARDAYTRASGYFSSADAPRLALSQLAVRTGDTRTAYALLEQALSGPGDRERDDPWWTYPSDLRRTTPVALAQAYEALLQPDTP